jgi:N,N'-diacetyllegionaminate synthase
LVQRLRLAQDLIGGTGAGGAASQDANRVAMRRSIAAAVDLPANCNLQMHHLCWVRPGTHIPPGREALVLGRTTKRPLRQGEIISIDDLN